MGFALDMSRAYLQKARIARLIDGAALAAAKVLRGQSGYEAEATRAACDSMQMNGAPVVMSGTTQCVATSGAPFTATVAFYDATVSGGPPLRNVRVSANQPVSTTFIRFLGWLVPGDYSTINVAAQSEAGPERPIDLMLVLDRSGSMQSSDGTGTQKLAALKTAVNGFLNLSNTFSSDDRVGMLSFAWRGCGNGSGLDSTATNCAPDAALDYTNSSYLSTLQTKVNALSHNGGNGGTNTMEALRTALTPLAAAFNDATRATTRKAILLVTDGQPTYLRRDDATQCNRNPRSGLPLPGPLDSGGQSGGCVQGVPTWTSGSTQSFMRRKNLALSSTENLPNNSTHAAIYRDVLRCSRSLTGCVTNGAMYEANRIRNCGYNNSSCSSGGSHDIVFFAIAIGQADANSPTNSLDANAKCLLARMANAAEIFNAATGASETLNSVCNSVFTTSVDGDTHADLLEAWPCGSGPCIDTSQEKGKVYLVDVTGNVTQQLNLIFQEIASILKLRLVL
jgi:hypothetical protein